MKDYILLDEWSIIEDKFRPEYNEISESLCSIGNGHMGMRANFEEDYSGASLQGSYIGGVYYPDKTKVGWWKNGYPEYFAKVLNSVNWIGLHIEVDGEILDLNTVESIKEFRRELDMMNGLLIRQFECKMTNGAELKIKSKRFVSMNETQLGALSYAIECLNKDVSLKITSYLDNDVTNKDSNYDEKFWKRVKEEATAEKISVTAETLKTSFVVHSQAYTQIYQKGEHLTIPDSYDIAEKYAEQSFHITLEKGEEVTIEKYVAILSTLNHRIEDFIPTAESILNEAVFKGMETIENEHSLFWHKIWNDCDIVIEGDVSAQQGIRFNIFQLYATYTGKDSRLNIGPKGFTGEKYGGSTYWDTEAYCLPFYMSTTSDQVAKNLLIYRHNHLQKAIENAQKLGFNNGAALYPMVTMNGEECHNEWEITFEEIHRNGAIAYAIYDYINYTADSSYLASHGLEVLIGISRFWRQRVNFSEDKGKWVMLGVTGPNEYENNVNNNWYTNYIAIWCLRYTIDALDYVKSHHHKEYEQIIANTSFDTSEIESWKEVIDNMYLPYDDKLGIYLQQDGYLDKEQMTVDQLAKEHRPLNQKWSWDRILRSCFIKQADVLQGIYFFENDFDLETIERNFKYYEPRTVHESSLSPCVHSILAAKIGMEKKSYEMYLRTSRLDLNDYNNDTEDGLHITSMAGTWLSIVKGFGGMQVKDGILCFNTFLPSNWTSLAFKIKFRGRLLKVSISKDETQITLEEGSPIDVNLNNKNISITQTR